MTKAELVAAMAEKAGMNRVQAKEALDAFIASVIEALREGEDVRVVGFGAFRSIHKPAGMARNPKTGATVRKPARRTCRFQAGDGLKSSLN